MIYGSVSCAVAPIFLLHHGAVLASLVARQRHALARLASASACAFTWPDSDGDVLSPTGIPKFYRWLSERYPLLNMPLTATEGPPELDNLYLDMNGIIHNCTHGNDPNQKLTEEEMILRIFAYLDKLIQLVRPKKLVFMAIDGEWVLPLLLQSWSSSAHDAGSGCSTLLRLQCAFMFRWTCLWSAMNNVVCVQSNVLCVVVSGCSCTPSYKRCCWSLQVWHLALR